MRYGKFIDGNTTDATDVIATSDGVEFTDSVLREAGFYPIVEVDEIDAPSREFRYTLVDDEHGGHIEQRTVIPPPPPRVFSKLKLKGAIATAGLLPAFKELLAGMEVAPGYTAQEAFDDAVNLSEAHPRFVEAVDIAKQVLAVTDEQVEEILAASVAEGST